MYYFRRLTERTNPRVAFSFSAALSSHGTVESPAAGSPYHREQLGLLPLVSESPPLALVRRLLLPALAVVPSPSPAATAAAAAVAVTAAAAVVAAAAVAAAAAIAAKPAAAAVSDASATKPAAVTQRASRQSAQEPEPQLENQRTKKNMEDEVAELAVDSIFDLVMLPDPTRPSRTFRSAPKHQGPPREKRFQPIKKAADAQLDVVGRLDRAAGVFKRRNDGVKAGPPAMPSPPQSSGSSAPKSFPNLWEAVATVRR